MIPLLLLLLACEPKGGDDGTTPGDGGTPDGGTGDGGTGDGGTEPATRWPTPVIAASTQVIDPTLDGAPTLDLSVTLTDRAAGATCEIALELHHDGGVLDLGVVAEGGGLSWDGTDGTEALPPGLCTLWAWSSCDDGSRGSASLPLAVVRLAPASIDLGAAVATQEQTVAFHKQGLLEAGPQAVVVPEYRLEGGVFHDEQPVVPPWTDPDLPPWTDDPDAVARNVPVALVAGASPRAAFTPALLDAQGRPTLPEGLTVALQGPAAADWVEGEVTLDPVEETLGVQSLALSWTWAACLGEGCTPLPLPGSRTTTHTLYRLAGPSQLRDASADGLADGTPWLGALADSVEAVQGLPSDDVEGAMDALRDRIYEDAWLVYDPSDSSYSEYDGPYIYWSSITSDLSGWLDRRSGTHLYCHSVSCLLSVMADHWGLPAEQIVLGVGFTTNLTHAAGTEGWERWYFNSHSVATLEDHALVWDAAVELDGDLDPYNEPAEALAPKSMPLEDYLEALTPDDIDIVNSGRCAYR